MFSYRTVVRPAQTDVSFNQGMMHEHSDAEPQLQEEISSVWDDTGLVKRCSDQAEIKRLRERTREGEDCIGKENGAASSGRM